MVTVNFFRETLVCTKVQHWVCCYWQYVALVVLLWHPALSALSSSASVTALRWEPVNLHGQFLVWV